MGSNRSYYVRLLLPPYSGPSPPLSIIPFYIFLILPLDAVVLYTLSILLLLSTDVPVTSFYYIAQSSVFINYLQFWGFSLYYFVFLPDISLSFFNNYFSTSVLLSPLFDNMIPKYRNCSLLQTCNWPLWLFHFQKFFPISLSRITSLQSICFIIVFLWRFSSTSWRFLLYNSFLVLLSPFRIYASDDLLFYSIFLLTLLHSTQTHFQFFITPSSSLLSLYLLHFKSIMLFLVIFHSSSLPYVGLIYLYINILHVSVWCLWAICFWIKSLIQITLSNPDTKFRLLMLTLFNLDILPNPDVNQFVYHYYGNIRRFSIRPVDQLGIFLEELHKIKYECPLCHNLEKALYYEIDTYTYIRVRKFGYRGTI